MRTGTGRALHPEVRAMSLSAQGEAKEETMPRKKRVIRKERRAQRNADAPDEAETADEAETIEESADVDTTLSSDAATADAVTDDTEATGDTTTEVAVVDESVDVSSTTEAGAATMDATSTTQVEADSSTAEEASGGPSPPNKEEAVLEPASSVPSETFGQEDPAKAFENIGADGPVVQELPTPDACDSGGTSLPTRPYTFDVNAPSSVPFTLSFRTSWSGEDPPKMEPNPVCIICWTIDPDTKPSNNKAQFFRGIDGQPPRIALMRMGNVVSYEEFSADGKKGTANSLTSATKLNDESEHEVVLVRGESKISMWIDGKPDCSLDASSIDFQNKDLPKGRPGHVAGKAATTNEYLRRQVKKTASYNKMDPFRGNWALSGDVTNVRLYSKELTANDFPDSKQSCEQTTTAEPFECHNTCKGCKGPTAKDCLSCMGMRFLHERQCIEDCPDGHFGEKDSNICLPCHDSCATCNAPKENDCQSCPSTYALHEGKCMSACPANYFADLNSVCQPLSGAVIALKTGGLGQAYLVTSNQTECVQLVPLESEEFSDPSKFIRDEAKMWMVSASGDKATLRNVKTGMALHWKAIEPGSEKVEGCTSEVSSCAVARPPKAVYGESALWTDSQWAIHKCQKNVFNILSLGGGKISLQQESRNLQFTKDVLSFSSEKIKDLSMEPESEAESEGLEVPDNSRFEPLVILKALKVTQKSSGRCEHLITDALSCSAAAGGLGLDDFADLTQQGANPKYPPGCFYYSHEFSAPGSKEFPVKMVRVVLNVNDQKADYLRFADCSAKMPCICALLE